MFPLRKLLLNLQQLCRKKVACIAALDKEMDKIRTIFFVPFTISVCGPDSSVAIATDYGLDGPGSNSGRDEIFRPYRPALGPTQSPVNGYRFFRGGKVRPGRAADHSPPSSAAVMEE